MFPLRITSSHAVVSSSIESMARDRAWAWHETLTQLNQARHRATRPYLGQQSSSKMATNNCSSCGTVILEKNLWPVSVVVWVFDDRNTLRVHQKCHLKSIHELWEESLQRRGTQRLLRFLLGRRTDPLVSMHDACPLTSLRISSTKAFNHGNRTGARVEPK